MSPNLLRSVLPTLAGLVVGAVGATLFRESLPGGEGSPQERVAKLESELKHAQNRLTALEATESQPRKAQSLLGKTRKLADGARNIAEDIREGRPVNPEDIFRASQPLIRDLAPLFDRMRVKSQKEVIDSRSGQLARKYQLNPEQQAKLKAWFEQKSNEDAKRWTDLVSRENTRLVDLMQASRDVRPDEGLDSFMPTLLSGQKLASFQAERMAERVQRVEKEADMKMQRVNSIVQLDESQQDQVFAIMARSSPDYDPAMVMQGARGNIGPAPQGDARTAMLSVLRPDQRTAYEEAQKKSRDEAAKQMEAMGLQLPSDWERLTGEFQ